MERVNVRTCIGQFSIVLISFEFSIVITHCVITMENSNEMSDYITNFLLHYVTSMFLHGNLLLIVQFTTLNFIFLYLFSDFSNKHFFILVNILKFLVLFFFTFLEKFSVIQSFVVEIKLIFFRNQIALDLRTTAVTPSIVTRYFDEV